ncbi:MAG: hypothetical protein PHQ99_08635, partial [Atribacterota bacterium]|nr:hypothetical protein [Atribacterota bacterium]
NISLPVGSYVLWANKPSKNQCPTSIGFTPSGNPDQSPKGWICLTVSPGGMHYYDIWVKNSGGSYPGTCSIPTLNACQ